MIKFMLTALVSMQIFVAAEEKSTTGIMTDPILDDVEYLDYLMDLKISSGSFLELDLSKSPMSMTIISSEMVRASNARNMSELLEIYVPGFQYMYNKWNGTMWGLRGIANDRNTKILYLVNGHKMNTQARDGFLSETKLSFLDDIERIEILRGPAGIVYGSGAIGGIINVVTKKADTNAIKVSSSITTDRAKTIETNIYAVPGDDQKISISAGYKQCDGFPTGKSRIYGNASWPNTPASEYGGPSDGNHGSTSGDWKIAGEWGSKSFNLYFRATRQEENAGGLFIIDPWPEKMGTPDSTNSARTIDGKTVQYNDPFYSNAESWRTSRRSYITNNIMVEGSYVHPIGDNEIKVNLGYDRNTTRIGTEARDRYETDYDYVSLVEETFGESRYIVNGMLLLKSVTNLQLAAGLEYRLDQIGDDMDGKNEKGMNPQHPVVSEINYNTLSLYSEGFYDFTDALGLHFGVRLDWHTRVLMANPKIALVIRPSDEHSIKAIFQTSSNNGSADNYEYNRWHIANDGTVSHEPYFERPQAQPGVTTPLLQPAPSIEKLHELKPEKVISAELTYVGNLLDNFTVNPSLALGHVKNLFGWSQTLFRCINVGNYNYLNLDLDGKYENKLISIGLNHAYQRPIRTDVDEQEKVYEIYSLDYSDSNSYYTYKNGKYVPVVEKDSAGNPLLSPYPVNLVKSTITYDGQNFLSLNTNVTKFYLTLSPLRWFSFHTDLRLFWGLTGRKALVKDENQYNYLGFCGENENQGIKDYLINSVSKKWNAGLSFNLPSDILISFNAYDILGLDRYSGHDTDEYTINTIRWQQMGEPSQKDLFSTDQRCFGLSISKKF